MTKPLDEHKDVAKEKPVKEKHHGSNEHDRQQSQKIAEKSRARLGTPFITLPSGEKYSLQGKCLICDKRIWMGHRCYLCATGEPRFFLRPEERRLKERSA